MPEVFLGLGSNVGDRQSNINKAIELICKIEGCKILGISPIYQNPALLPTNYDDAWNCPFLNIVLKFNIQNNDPVCFLKELKLIEKKVGRQLSPKWAPRIIDIDILLWGEKVIHTEELTVPHPGMLSRDFVLAPTKGFKTTT